MSKNRVLPDWIDFFHPVPHPKNVVSAAEMDLGLYDWLVVNPDVKSLISDLGLVSGSMPKDWIIHCKTPLFCDVVKAFHARQSVDRVQFCREIYLRNRKHSRYVYRSYFGEKV